MGDAADRPIFLRNALPEPILLPLAAGGRRYLPACATTAIDRATRDLSPIALALAAGIVVVVMLPPPKGEPWRLPADCGLLSPVSAGARHYLAARTGMDRQILAAKTRERGERWAMRDVADARRRERERREQVAELLRTPEPGKLPPWTMRARAAYRLLVDRAQQAELAEKAFLAVLDGEIALPVAMNGTKVLPRSVDEISHPIGNVRTIRRFQRRAYSARRLLEAAKVASGEADPAQAARWLIERLADPPRQAVRRPTRLGDDRSMPIARTR